MVYFKITAVAALTTSVAFQLPGAHSSSYILSDDRVRSLDVAPALGRGYSIMTNGFHSTCLDIDVTSVPSYNYEYTFTDFTQSEDLELEVAGSISNTFAYDYVKGQIEESLSMIKTDDYKYHVVATMRIERFYSSVREELSPLVRNASALLDKQDYVGFFKACGPNYVRSIRRAQEVTAVFSYLSSNVELAQEFATGLKSSNKFGATVDHTQYAKAKFDRITSSLDIKILGFGLGLDQRGSGSLVAPTLDEYNEVMRFAFKAMTQNASGNSRDIGQVYGIEISPWVDNVNFQIISKLHEESIEIPLPRSLLAKAFTIDVADNSAFANDISTRAFFRCKDPSYMIDMYGYCCEREALYLPNKHEYNYKNPLLAICRPIRNLDTAVMKNNMAANAEFVSRLDYAVQSRYNQFGTLERCVSSTRMIPTKWDNYYIRPQGSAKFDSSIQRTVTLKDLRTYIDPMNDYSFVQHMGEELDEWMDMYYQPCIAALYGMHIGLSSDVEVAYFMAYPWHTHDECTRLSCLPGSMRWNRESPICTDSLIAGMGIASFDTPSDAYCSYDAERGTGPQKCKYDTLALANYQTQVETQWNTTNGGRIDYMMEQFCMPVITGKKKAV